MKSLWKIAVMLGLILLSDISFAGELGFFEIIVANQKRAQAFYSEAMGWTFREIGASNFVLIENAGIKGALLSTTEKIKRGESVKIFFKTSQLQSSIVKIKKAGGSIEIEPTDTGNDNWIAEFKDPDGNWIGLTCDGKSCIKPSGK